MVYTTSMEEVWKDIPNYEGRYQVSNMGRIKSLPREMRCGNGMGIHKVKERILSQVTRRKVISPNGSTHIYNYAHVMLKKMGQRQTFQVHRLVAKAFIPNPDNLSDVNHKDENGLNNRVDNLEWMSHKDNCNYGTRNQRSAAGNINNPSISRRVLQLTVDGKPIKEYPSAKEAYRQTGVWPTSIQDCANHGRHKTAGGYKWEWLEPSKRKRKNA